MSERAPNPMSLSTERKVGMGELDVLRGVGVLRTLLGSCIGLVLHDPKNCVGGLAHIVLPESNGLSHLPGKYANTAIPELIRQIERAGGQPQRLVAKFSGGANMFATSRANAVGDLNIARVECLLNAAGIPVLGKDCGGKQGRRTSFNVETGKVIVEIVGGRFVEL